MVLQTIEVVAPPNAKKPERAAIHEFLLGELPRGADRGMV